jgi:hypothetical protein
MPTHASQINQVEPRIRGSHRPVRHGLISLIDLFAKYRTFFDAYNARSAPFVWTAVIEAILEKS